MKSMHCRSFGLDEDELLLPASTRYLPLHGHRELVAVISLALSFRDFPDGGGAGLGVRLIPSTQDRLGGRACGRRSDGRTHW